MRDPCIGCGVSPNCLLTDKCDKKTEFEKECALSKANETNQTKPEFKIESCEVCPARDVCSNFYPRDNACKETKKKIEVLVNAKR